MATWPDRKHFPQELRSWFPYLMKLRTDKGYQAFPRNGFLTGHGMFAETPFYIWEDGRYKADLALTKKELRVGGHILISHMWFHQSFTSEVWHGASRTTHKSSWHATNRCRWRCPNGRSYLCAGRPSPSRHDHHPHCRSHPPQAQTSRSRLPQQAAEAP